MTRAHVRELLRHDIGVARLVDTPEGDLQFKYEGVIVLVLFDEADPSFLWIRVPNILCIPVRERPRLDYIDACVNHTNHHCKVVKLARAPKPDCDGDWTVSSSVSVLLASPASLASGELDRYLFHAKAGARHFLDQLGPRERYRVPLIDLSGDSTAH